MQKRELGAVETGVSLETQIEKARVATIEKIIDGELNPPIYQTYSLNNRSKKPSFIIDAVLASFPAYHQKSGEQVISYDTQVIAYQEDVREEDYWKKVLGLNIPKATARIERKEYGRFEVSPEDAFESTKNCVLTPNNLPLWIIVFGKFRNGKEAVQIVTPGTILPSLAVWDMYWTAKTNLEELKKEKRRIY